MRPKSASPRRGGPGKARLLRCRASEYVFIHTRRPSASDPGLSRPIAGSLAIFRSSKDAKEDRPQSEGGAWPAFEIELFFTSFFETGWLGRLDAAGQSG